jgi:DNA-directed RNA polymerase beta subunit
MPFSEAELFNMIGGSSPKKAAALTPSKPAPSPVIQLQDDGETYQPVGLNGILASTEKLLAVNRGIVDADARDHMAYKRVISPAKMLRERIRLDADKTRRSLMRVIARKKSLNALSPGAFDGYVDGLLNGNPLATPLEEINPLSLLEQARRLSHFGPGGIGSSDAITEDMQAVSADQFGFISTLEGPESEKAGVDVRAAQGTKLGSDGRIYQRFRRKDGSYQWMSPEDVQDLTVKLPD